MSSSKAIVIELNDENGYQRLLGGEPQTCGMRSGKVFLSPSENCGQHSTRGNEEMLVFLSGKGTAIIAEEVYEVDRGRVIYIPPQTSHDIKNTGAEPLVYVYCVAPANKTTGEHKPS